MLAGILSAKYKLVHGELVVASRCAESCIVGWLLQLEMLKFDEQLTDVAAVRRNDILANGRQLNWVFNDNAL